MTSSSTRRSSSSTGSSRGRTLYLDLISERRSIAFAAPEGRWRVQALPVRLASEAFLPAITRFLERHRAAAKGLRGLVVVTGAGTFTEARSAVTIANAIGLARGLPVVAVSRLGVEETSESIFRRGIAALRHAPRGALGRPAYSAPPNISSPKPPGLRRKPAVHRTAAGIVVHRGRVLLIWDRTHEHLVIPGGHVEAGESGVAAARREVREETGHEPGRILAELPTVRFRGHEDGQPVTHVERRFVFRLRRASRAPTSARHGGRKPVWLPIREAVSRVPYPDLKHNLKLAGRFTTVYGRRRPPIPARTLTE